MNCCDDYGNCRGGHGCPIGDDEVDLKIYRTMEEAFGPGSDLDAIDMELDNDCLLLGDRAVMWACVACALLVLVLAVLGDV